MGLVPRHGEIQIGHSGQTRRPATQILVASLAGMGRESNNIQLRAVGQQTVPRMPAASPPTRKPKNTRNGLDRRQAGGMAGGTQLPREEKRGVGPDPPTAPGTRTPGPWDATRKSHHQSTHRKATAALVIQMSLHEPGVVYKAAKAPDLQDIPIMTGCDPHAMLWQK